MPEHEAWCVTRYEDVLAVLKDNATYSSRKVIRFAQLAPEFEQALADAWRSSGGSWASRTLAGPS